MSQQPHAQLGEFIAGMRGEVRHLPERYGAWAVFEYVDGRAPDAGVVLVFASSFAVRRCTEYPTGWRELTDAELLEICGRPV